MLRPILQLFVFNCFKCVLKRASAKRLIGSTRKSLFFSFGKVDFFDGSRGAIPPIASPPSSLLGLPGRGGEGGGVVGGGGLITKVMSNNKFSQQRSFNRRGIWSSKPQIDGVTF